MELRAWGDTGPWEFFFKTRIGTTDIIQEVIYKEDQGSHTARARVYGSTRDFITGHRKTDFKVFVQHSRNNTTAFSFVWGISYKTFVI